MVFPELFMSLWDLTPEVRQALALRLLNHAGPFSYELPDDLATEAEEKFTQIVSHLAHYQNQQQRTCLLADLLAFLVNDHRVWLYRTQAPCT